ncbi:hypothetical protein CYA_0455 [Synechococcus sp. JA-3-3Ab]|nr:hypothetical protein CYA_0455 [Synechococcus sp. JA-3-3Ab]
MILEYFVGFGQRDPREPDLQKATPIINVDSRGFAQTPSRILWGFL